jgi:hypothetical protein
MIFQTYCTAYILSFYAVYVFGFNITVAEFIDPDWGDNVNSGIGLSYRPARLHGLPARYDNPMPELTSSPSHGSIEFVHCTHLLKHTEYSQNMWGISVSRANSYDGTNHRYYGT